MTKAVSLLGVMVAVSLGMIALIAPSGSSDVMALEDISRADITASICTKKEIIAQDQSYGVNQTVDAACAK